MKLLTKQNSTSYHPHLTNSYSHYNFWYPSITETVVLNITENAHIEISK